jgi:hypothetical protein
MIEALGRRHRLRSLDAGHVEGTRKCGAPARNVTDGLIGRRMPAYQLHAKGERTKRKREVTVRPVGSRPGVC